MNAVILEVVVILLLIIVNGILSLAEIAVLSARKARLQQAAENGDRGAQTALDLANEPSRFLATVQVGITLIGMLAGVISGVTIAAQLETWLKRIPPVAPYSKVISVGVVVLVITLLTLILGELTPKRIALTNAERIAAAIAPLMKVLAKITAPFVSFLSASTDLMLRIFGVKSVSPLPVTEEEIRILLEQGTQVGVFEPMEEEMVEQVFRLGDRKIGALITPRTEIIWLDLEAPDEENRQKIISGRHSRYPVARGGLDNVVGVVLTKDLLSQSLACLPLDIESVMQPPLFVPESVLALDVLERFKEQRTQMALVIDEYGGLQGLVTVEDILEEIVGDLPEHDEEVTPEIVQREDGSWLIDGMLPIDEFLEFFGIDEIPEDEIGDYQTLGGFVMTALGRIPVTGDYFEWQNYRFEIVDMDGRRVDKLLIMPVNVAD